jgi:hypothetical protein
LPLNDLPTFIGPILVQQGWADKATRDLHGIGTSQKNLKFRASNNLLEHLAAIISPWVDILAGRLNSQDCVLSMTDSTTAEGWLKKSNFSKLEESKIQSSVRIKASQMQATLFMSLGIMNYSQWFKRESNKVSDALSRDDDQDDEELTNIF